MLHSVYTGNSQGMGAFSPPNIFLIPPSVSPKIMLNVLKLDQIFE